MFIKVIALYLQTVRRYTMNRITIFLLIGFIINLTSYYTFSQNLSPLKNGIKLYKQGKYELSLVYLEKAYKENPMDTKLHFYIGNIYNHKKQFSKSVEFYKRGIELSKGNEKHPFLLNLARTYQSALDYKEALNTYDQLQKLTDEYPKTYLYKGMIYYNLKNKEGVVGSWETYLQKDPTSPQYQSIRKALDIIKSENFKWSKQVSKGARGEDKKIIEDNKDKKEKKAPSSEKEIKEEEDKLVNDLKEKEKQQANKEIENSVSNVKVDSEDIEVKEQPDKKEGKEFDEVER